MEQTPRGEWVDSVTLHWDKDSGFALETFVFKDDRSTELADRVIVSSAGNVTKKVTMDDWYVELKNRCSIDKHQN